MDEGPAVIGRSVDVSNLPPDSILRVAEMTRARRARLLAEEETWAQEGTFGDKEDEFAQQELRLIMADEDTARSALHRTEEKARDRILRSFAENELLKSEAVGDRRQRQQFEKLRQREMKSLNDDLKRKAFYAFWEKERSSGSKATHSHSQRSGSERPLDRVNEATMILRMAYHHSVPPFTTDPEEVWRRGVTVAPDFQHQDPVGAELNLPRFHEYAARMRNKFMESQHQKM
jgi:hypothetical protein